MAVAVLLSSGFTILSIYYVQRLVDMIAQCHEYSQEYNISYPFTA